MAVSRNNVTAVTLASSTTPTTTHNNNGEGVLVFVMSRVNNPTAITFGGVSMTLIANSPASDNAQVSAWQLPSAPTGSQTVAYTCPTARVRRSIIVSYTGCDAADIVRDFVTNSGSGSGAWAVSGVDTDAADLLALAYMYRNDANATPTVPGDQTALASPVLFDFSYAPVYEKVPATDPESGEITPNTAAGWSAILISVKSGGATAAEFAASLSATATVSAALTTEITLATNMQASAALVAALSTQIQMAASLPATAMMAAALETQIQMAAALNGAASITADLEAGTPAAEFEAILQATAQVSAGLVTDIQMAAFLLATAQISRAELDVPFIDVVHGGDHKTTALRRILIV